VTAGTGVVEPVAVRETRSPSAVGGDPVPPEELPPPPQPMSAMANVQIAPRRYVMYFRGRSCGGVRVIVAAQGYESGWGFSTREVAIDLMPNLLGRQVAEHAERAVVLGQKIGQR
jgi:hypothetical protein